MSRTCDGLAELRSGLVDGALSPGDRERVVVHLLGCPACRADVEGLRAVRELLGRTPPPAAPPPPELSRRLAAIAGDARTAPLGSRAFRCAGAGALPSRRRRARLRAAVGVLAAGLLATALGAVGWAAAPAADLPAVVDPAGTARAELGAAAGKLSVTGSTLSALIMLDALPSVATDGSAVLRPGHGTGSRLAATSARRVLRRAATATRSVSLEGRQTVLVRSGDRLSAGSVEVDTRRGQGSVLSLLGPDGAPMDTSFAPVSPTAQEEMFRVLADAYDLSGRTGATVVGRPATVVAATRQGQVVRRWWVDDATGVLLWQEGYDPSEALTVAAGFSTLRVGAASAIIDHLPPRTEPAGLATSPSTAGVHDLAAGGWACADRLVGLEVLGLGTDLLRDPRTVHLVYGDGVRTLSVLQQRGWLADAPRGAAWDRDLGVWRHEGVVSWATWESGDTVLTVTTDEPRLLRAAIASLPRERPVATTTLGRVRDGWSKILADPEG